MLYDPNAIAIVDGEPKYLFVYTMLDSVEDAMKCFYGWQNNYNYTILSWWINDNNGNKVKEGICFNTAGQLVDLDGNRIVLNKKQTG